MTKTTKSERAEAIARLREWLPPGSTVHTIMRHVSRSGMQREIDLIALTPESKLWLSGLASKALGIRRGKRDGLIVGGCGMDMGFHVVYELSATLYPDGFTCTGQRDDARGKYCPSNDHSNGDRNYEPHHHKSGGYALRQEWL